MFVGYETQIAIFLLTYVLLWGTKTYAIRYFESLAKKSKTHLDNIVLEGLNQIRYPFYVVTALFTATRGITVPMYADRLIFIIFYLGVAYYTIRIAVKIIAYSIRQRQDSSEVPRLITNGVAALLWLIAVLLILSNLGVEISALITGLGIGGIAVAFALQTILEDLFASFSIYFDKPFEEGDFIEIGDDRGTVEHIGLKTTRIRTLRGEQLVVSNRELTSTRIHNHKRMDDRRASFEIGVEYGLSREKLEDVKSILQNILQSVDGIEPNRVHLRSFGNSAIIFEAVFTVQTDVYEEYIALQEQINLDIVSRFTDEDIPLAFPTQTVYLRKE